MGTAALVLRAGSISGMVTILQTVKILEGVSVLELFFRLAAVLDQVQGTVSALETGSMFVTFSVSVRILVLVTFPKFV